MTHPDPMLQALYANESRLADWLGQSAANAEMFRSNPLAAIRAAKLELHEDILSGLEEAVTGIMLKLKAG